MARRNGMDEKDERLWSLVAAQLEPLASTRARLKEAARKAAIEEAQPASAPAARARPAAKPKKKTDLQHLAMATRAATAPTPPAAAAEDARGRVAGLDRRNAERLRKGQYPIDARLDLHGMNQAQAQRALGLFVRQCHAAQKRCLLVITGKGGRQRPRDDGPYVNAPEAGVLKRAVPGWLREGELARLVLATAQAVPEHGGGGALYILLKRHR